MKQVVFLSLCILLVATVPRMGLAAASDIVPQSDPALRNVDTLQKAGIIFGDPDSAGNGRRVLTRKTFANAIVRLIAETSPHASTGRQMDVENRLLASPPAIEALRSLVDEFAPDLALMHENVAEDRAWLITLTNNSHPLLAPKSFPDVPPSHWAASSVEFLRLHGIIGGYGNGNFGVSQ